jgi:hypothetical protein
MEKSIQNLHEDVFTMYSTCAARLNWLEKQLRANAHNQEYCVDAAFALKELNKLVEDIGVEIRKRLELAESIVAYRWLIAESDEPIRTEYCTASVRIQLQPAMPPKDSAELAAMYDWLGIEHNRDIVRIHWPSLCKLVTELVEQSKPLPPGITPENLHNPRGRLTFYKRKEVTE